jgi:hypothetical protein
MDPILAYLLEFNQHNSIEYSDRYIIPAGGLAKMLNEFQQFRLNRVEVIKEELTTPPEPVSQSEETIEELYELID